MNITGSAFYTYSSDGLTGTKSRTSTVNLDFKSKNWGAFVSGPIIKDKLFIALAYEWLEEGTPIAIGTAGFANVVPNLTDAQIANIASIAQSGYDYDTLGVTRTTLEKDKKYTAKLDWNVSETQRLALTYIRNDSENSATAGFSSTSPTSPILGLASNNYSRPEKVDSFVAQLVSDWADNFHTEIRGNYRAYDLSPVPSANSRSRRCRSARSDREHHARHLLAGLSGRAGRCAPLFRSRPVPPFQLCAHQAIWRGLRHALDDGRDRHEGDGRLVAPRCRQCLRAERFRQLLFRLGRPVPGQEASQLALGGSITGNLNDVLASFKYDQYTFGFQGSYERPTISASPPASAATPMAASRAAVQPAFLRPYRIRNNAVINGKMVIQPRVSFTWSPMSEVRVRGGIGLFAGGSPDVFLGNSYSVAGVFNNAITISRNADGTCTLPTPTICAAALNNVDGRTINPIVTDYLRTNVGTLSLSNVNAMDPEYEMESTWKSSLSVDYTPYELGFLGGGWGFGADVLLWLGEERAALQGSAPGAERRGARWPPALSDDHAELREHRSPAHQQPAWGNSLVLVARASKSFDFGLSLDASYTFQDIKDVSAMNGTTATGTYGQTRHVRSQYRGLWHVDLPDPEQPQVRASIMTTPSSATTRHASACSASIARACPTA